MGINIILPLIIGMALMVSLGSQVVPSFVEQMKVAKVENRTISNQNLIKDAIVRYIKMEKKVPKNNDLEVLEKYGLLRGYNNDNLFGGGYGFTIDKKKGILKIFTTINDEGAGKYFSNSFKFPNAPTCKQALDSNGVCVSGEFQTFYLLDNEVFDVLKNIKLDYSDPEYIKEFTLENIGKKDYYEKNPPKDGDKDNVVHQENGAITGTITEYIYKEKPDGTGNWEKNGEPKNIGIGNIGSNTGVFISNLKIPYHEWNETEKKLVPKTYEHEKVHCNAKSDGKEVLVVNQITGLAELVWVAPNNVSSIQNKIFGNSNETTRQSATNIVGNDAKDLKYIPNNICTSNLTSFYQMFYLATNFNQPLDRWDTSNATSMIYMFNYATNFNQPVNFDTSNVKDMGYMFSYAKKFDQPINFDTSKVGYMNFMFNYAINFNQDISKFNTSLVIWMGSMFSYAEKFNQDLSKWCVIEISSKPGFFDLGSGFVNKTSIQPKWKNPCP